MNSDIKQVLEEIFEKEKNSEESARIYAKEMLYGFNSIDLNSQRYLENILINFCRKKEIIIPKIYIDKKTKFLYFDIDKNWKSVWDIIFLGEIISEEILKNIDIKLDIKKISDKEVIIENLPQGIKSEYVQKLKESIKLIQKIKDSIAHKDNENICKKIVENGNVYVDIKNMSGQIPFKGKILLNYLEGFINNKIIPLKEDIEITNKTNEVAYPILDKLGYDPKQIQNFFYRTDPVLLNYILQNIENDYEILYKLPIKIFSMKINDLDKILNHNKVKNINSLIGLSDCAFENVDRLFELLELVEKIEDLAAIDGVVFFDIDFTSKLLKHPKVKSIKSLKNLPHGVFYSIELISNILNHPKVDSIESLKKLPNHLFSFSQPLLKLLASSKIKKVEDLNEFSKMTFSNIKEEKKLLNKNINIKEYINFNDIEYIYSKEIKKLLKNSKVNNFEDVIFLIELMKTNGKKMIFKLLNHPKIDMVESLKFIDRLYFSNIELFIKLLNNSKIKSVNDLIGVPVNILYDKNLLNSVDTILSLKGLPNTIVNYFDVIQILLKHPKVKSIESLSGLNHCAFEYLDSTLSLLEHPKIKHIENLRGLPDGGFIYPRITQKLLSELKIENVECLKDLPIEFFEHFSEIEEIYIKYGEYSLEIMKNIPIRLYQTIKIGNTESTQKISEKSYKNIKLSNLSYLLERVNNNAERLFEFPEEFFTCDFSLLDSMLLIYNNNISKSIFGNYKPKTIILINYLHTVLTSRKFTKISQKECREYSIIDFDDFRDVIYVFQNNECNLKSHLISKTVINPKKYEKIKKHMDNFNNVNSIEALEKINKKNIEMINELKEELILEKGKNISIILGHLRNACSHFYFEELDNNRIKIYDINEEGKITFESIFPMKSLFELIKNVQNIENENIELLIDSLSFEEIESLEKNFKILNENSNLRKNLNLRLLEDIKKYLNDSINVNNETNKKK